MEKCYCYDPETKRQSSQWKHAGSPKTKKARQCKSPHKLLIISFFDSIGMTFMHWVPTGQTVNKEYSFEVLREFSKKFGRGQNSSNRVSGISTSPQFHPCHRLFPQPPYSPDLAPCDFWLFPKPKEDLRGCRYETIEEMKEAVTKVIDALTQENFHGASQKLLEQYKCIAAGGDYFEGD